MIRYDTKIFDNDTIGLIRYDAKKYDIDTGIAQYVAWFKQHRLGGVDEREGRAERVE